MRIPGISEPSAFHVAMATAVIAGVSVGIGALLGAVAGVITLAAFVAVAVIYQLYTKDPTRRLPLREASDAPHLHGATPGVRHLLVVADAPLHGDDLRLFIVEHGGEHHELDVLAPVHISRSHLATSDFDREKAAAEQRLHASLGWAKENGFAARGEVGDPDPLTSLEDELRDFGPDEVILVGPPRERAPWAEARELDHLRAELDIPVSHFVLDGHP